MEVSITPASAQIVPVILCGGKGTRLWPLSRKAYPKQFIPLVGDKSLLQLTLERLGGPELGAGAVLCIAAEDHRFLVADAALQARQQVRQILEPQAKNTAPAMALAVHKAGPNDLLLFCPADHFIPDTAAFAAMVRAAVPAAAQGSIVTFGVVPTAPSTAYGYIERGEALPAGGHAVVRFVEKPAAAVAEQLLAGGRHLWNAGIFLARADVLAAALQQHAPAIWAACARAMQQCSTDGQFIRPQPQAFAASPSESIDYAVMEKFSNLAVFPFSGTWSDVGSWNAVADMGAPSAGSNRSGGAEGHAEFLHASHTYIHASHRPVVALGTQNLLIIDTPDALLVADAAYAEQVKEAVAALEAKSAPEAEMHRKVARPWGTYDTVDQGPRHQVKRITVRPGARLSLQLHHHRAEHWVVVVGTALVTRGEEQIVLHENQSIYIPLGVKHRLENQGTSDLEIIEIQSGHYLGEDDIVRFEDAYGRMEASAKT